MNPQWNDAPVSRAELADLQRRVDKIDRGGTRGVGVLAVQIQELAKDLAAHEKQHEQERQARAAMRRWLVGAFIAAVAAVDGPVVAIVLARGGR